MKNIIMKVWQVLLVAVVSGLCMLGHGNTVPTAWRIVPILSSKMQMSVGFFERSINSLLSLNFGTVQGMPLYEKGAPRSVFIVDTDDSKTLILSRVDFIQKGSFYKAPPCDVLAFFEKESHLQNLIRATTGIDNPRGFVLRNSSDIDRESVMGILYISFPDFFIESLFYLLQASASLRYKPSHDVHIRRAAQHPFIFVSSRVTDAMLLQAFEKISWEAIESYATKHRRQSTHDVKWLRKSYDRFHQELSTLQSNPHAYNDVLCIV